MLEKKSNEKKGNVNKYRLPFGLCKKYGIPIQDWWTPTDAWRALKKKGVVDDVSKEYRNYFKKAQRRRKQTKEEKEREERIKAWQRTLPDHNPLKNYVHKDGYIAGVPKGKPMSFDEADNGSVNPYFIYDYYYGYDLNCQTCVPTFLARLHGYNVRALPNLDNETIDYISDNILSIYIDKDGNHPQYTRKPLHKWNITFLEEKVKDNRLYDVYISWIVGQWGHEVLATRRDGIVTIYDPQSDQYYQGRRITKFFSDGYGLRIADITDCKVDERLADKIMRGV